MNTSRSDVEIALGASFLLATNTLAVVGNTLVCLAVYRNRSLLTAPYLSILALSIADLTVALCCMPFCASAAIVGRWPFGRVFCQINGFIVYCWAANSLYVLMLTAVNRFFRICRRAAYRRLFTLRNTLLFIVAGGILIITGGLIAKFQGPILFLYNPRRFFCVSGYDDAKKRLQIGLTLHVVHIFLPTLVIVVCYVKVFRTVRHHNLSVAPSLRAQDNMNLMTSLSEIRVTRLLFTVLVGFLLCWTPVLVIGSLGNALVPLPRFADLAYTCLAFTSSVINPFIYGVMNRAFRKEFLKILRCAH